MEKFENRIEQIRLLAKVYDWQETKFSEWDSLLSFRRRGVLMNVWYTKMTVGTALEHPTLGKTQMFRKHVSIKLLKDLFVNPRVHTTKGYTQKTSRNLGRWYK